LTWDIITIHTPNLSKSVFDAPEDTVYYLILKALKKEEVHLSMREERQIRESNARVNAAMAAYDSESV
jgi:hypothetical protein